MRFIITLMVLLMVVGAVGGRNRRNRIELLFNGYRNILIAINEDVKENSALLENIKQSFRDASRFLYHATKRRAYFKHIKILLPSSWSDDPSYTRARLEAYDNADIFIVPWGSYGTNTPFVRSSNRCGVPGDFMQLTDKFFFDPTSIDEFGAREKVLVHEWAHLHWGVFDEYPRAGMKRFYYSSRTQSYEPVRCTREVRGKIGRLLDGTDRLVECELDPRTGRYAEGCIFVPWIKNDKNGGVDASLMDRHNVDSIKFFCDDGNHNEEAPNKHNKLCSGRSVWDVITSSPDFAGGKNPPRTISDADLMPKFTVRKDHRILARVVFVLDESGSMSDQNKMLRMIQAVTKFIRSELKTGSYVGVVMFSSSARLLVPLTKLNSTYTREQIIRHLPLNADGGTSIGSGLKKAVEAENSTTTATQQDQITSILTDIAKPLNRIASGSSPKSQATASFSLSRRIDRKATLTQTAYLNEGLGLNTRLVITYVSRRPSFKVTSPSGRVYNVTSPETVVDRRTKTINLLIPGIAETGQWLFSVTNAAASVPEDFGLTFASFPTNKTETMVLKALSNAVEGVWPPEWTIRAVVKKGNLPVTGLSVTATIDRPGASPIDLELRDDGTGADLQKNDGVYSRYFTQFTAKGRYSISLSAVADPGQSSVLAMDPSQGLALVVDPDRPSYYAENIRKYTRKIQSIPVSSGVSLSTSGGALEFKPPADKEILLRRKKDIFPPGRIVDLDVVATDPNGPSVTLKWTATGDDMDWGTATKYNVYVNTTIAGNKTSQMINQGDLLLGNLTYPKSSGQAERFIVRVPYDGVRNTSYVFRVTATDDAGFTGDDSNPAAAGLGSVPPLIEITSDEVTTSRTSLSASGIPTSVMPNDGVLNTLPLSTVRSTDDAGHTQIVSDPPTPGLGSVPPRTKITTDEVTTPRTKTTRKA